MEKHENTTEDPHCLGSTGVLCYVIICYDNACKTEHEYFEEDVYDYFDAAFGEITAVTCKTCGLTNMVH